ncbi:vitamin K epoxide reductase family protein [Okeania sp.]|uniref:vitamin K epoxide reductase family protein n=1 Tax=Okeania sp. TaxID=3100323 RepID=UPI002B4AB1D6|nr:vitamin K epoxide reductase family protein [Okeania sp.]MEB3339222.1 vitamin K epoxide reductase family protein [Okeania sp.]
MRSKRSKPWIHRNSRFIIAGIAAVGVAITAYLTIEKLTGGTVVCPVDGCDNVLNSEYATILGLPLALFGFLAYVSMGTMAIAPWLINSDSQKQLRSQLENWSWLFMFVGSVSMTIFSSYLMYIMAFEIESLCLYCTGSAICSLSLLILTLIGRNWEDIGQLIFTAIIVGMVTLVGIFAVYSPIYSATASTENTYGVTTASTPAKVALAEHLTEVGAKMYGAYWCSHCQEQKNLFGKEAVSKINYIECDPKGKNSQTQLCVEASIKAYPTWEINGKVQEGVVSMENLAKLSGYKGPTNF